MSEFDIMKEFTNFPFIVSFIVLGEKPTLYQIVGGSIIIMSGVIVGLENKK